MQFVKGILLILCVYILSGNINARALSASQQSSQIQHILNNWRARLGASSATLSLLLPGNPTPQTFVSGAMCLNGKETTPNTLFQAGSITKSFTSTLILQLEAEGKLNINDAITKYLPQYREWSNVTIRQLLNHTSGIFNYTETGAFNKIRKYEPQKEFTPAEIIYLASQHHDYFLPGHGWKYSNTNYVLAGMIIEKVTGQPIATVMQHYLHNTNLNLKNTDYISDMYSNNILSRIAHGYSSDGHDVTLDNMSWACTAGAIVSTTEDLLTWWRSLFQHKILPSRQMTEMQTLVCEKDTMNCYAGRYTANLSDSSVGKGYGLGIIQSAFGSNEIGSVWWHNGSTKGYKAIVMWYPKMNIYMALMVDRDPGYFLTPGSPIVQNVLNVLLPKPVSHRQVYTKIRIKHLVERRHTHTHAHAHVHAVHSHRRLVVEHPMLHKHAKHRLVHKPISSLHLAKNSRAGHHKKRAS